MGKVFQFPKRCGVCLKFYLCLTAKGVDLEKADPEKIEELMGTEGCAVWVARGPEEKEQETSD